MDAYTHQAPMTDHEYASNSNVVQSLDTAREIGLGSPLSLAQKSSSLSSPAINALRSKSSPFVSETFPNINSNENIQEISSPYIHSNCIGSGFTLAPPVEPSTWAPLRPISNLPVTTTAPSASSATSNMLNPTNRISNSKCMDLEAPMDLSQISFLKELGPGGSASVFKVKNATGCFALKVMKKGHDNDKQWYNECNFLEYMKGNLYVVQLVAASELLCIPSLPKSAFFDAYTPVRTLALEYYPRGELYDIVAQFKHGLPETIAKIYMRQLWQAVCSCHGLNVAHCDIKPDNIVVAKDWSLRLADFGLAKTSNAWTRDQRGTKAYKAPETHSIVPDLPGPTDVWSAGVTCFVILCGGWPFEASETKDKCFRLAAKGDWGQFWQHHDDLRLNMEAAPLGAEAKRFLQRALDPKPRSRPSAEAMLNVPWLNDAAPGGAGPGDAELEGLMKGLGVKSPYDKKGCSTSEGGDE